MKILRIKFTNYAQHLSRDISITGGVVALVGRNGSGKSNFLSGMGDTIVGEYSRELPRLVSWGEEKGLLEEWLEIDDRHYYVSRELPSGKARLECEGEETLTKATAVNARLLELLGTEKAILQSVVFVKQKEIESLLFSRDGVKDRLAQKFFGIERVGGIEKGLSKEIASIIFDSADQHLPQLMGQRREQSDKIMTMQEALQLLGSPILIDEITAAEAFVHSNRTLASRVSRYRELTAQLDRYVAQESSIASKLATDHATFDKIDSAQIETLYQGALAKVRENQEIGRLDQNIATYQKQVDEMAEAPSTAEKLAQDREALTQQHSKLMSLNREIQEAEQLLASIGTSPICPTCHQSIDLSQREPIEQTKTEKEGQYRELYGQYTKAKAA